MRFVWNGKKQGGRLANVSMKLGKKLQNTRISAAIRHKKGEPVSALLCGQLPISSCVVTLIRYFAPIGLMYMPSSSSVAR